MYPKNKDDAEKFSIGIIESLHNEKTRPGIMKQLTVEGLPTAPKIAGVVSMVITSMLQRVKTQAGRKPHIQLLLKAIKMTVLEVSQMAQVAGIEVTPEDEKEAAKIAGDMIQEGQEVAMQSGQQGQPGEQMQPQPQEVQPQQAPQQPQGILGGAR